MTHKENLTKLNTIVKTVAKEELAFLAEGIVGNGLPLEKYLSKKGVKAMLIEIDKNFVKETDLIRTLEDRLGKKFAKLDLFKSDTDILTVKHTIRVGIRGAARELIQSMILDAKMKELIDSIEEEVEKEEDVKTTPSKKAPTKKVVVKKSVAPKAKTKAKK